MTSREHFLDPSVLAEVDNYALLARTIVEGFIAGLHRSLYHGFGSEFVQYRNYTPGDDFKYLDWKVYGRSDKYQIKVFQEETNTNCYIVLDASASMAYTGAKSRISKLQYAKIMVACLTYLVRRQGDSVGLYAYSDQLHCCVNPGHRAAQTQTIFGHLARVQPSGKGAHKTILAQLTELVQRRGIVILIGDFLDIDDEVLKTIRYFRVAHHDCVVFHILDDDEVEFPFAEDTQFVDSETADEIITSPANVRDRYRASFTECVSNFERFCWKNNIDYNRTTTSQPLGAVLAAYLHRREQFQ